MSDTTRTPQPALGVEERNTGTLTLPTQSHYEVAIELQDYDRNAVERLYRAVWPGRPLPTTDADLDTETAGELP
jgi:hypothetical protein